MNIASNELIRAALDAALANANNGDPTRELSTVKTKIEEAIMWNEADRKKSQAIS